MLSILKKVFGDKSAKDLKEINPFVDKVKEVYNNISKLTNDELRNKTHDFKNRIVENTKEEETEINRIKDLIANDPEMDVEVKEEHYSTIDNLTKLSYDKTQAFLNDILPEAFSAVKHSATRFGANVLALDLEY